VGKATLNHCLAISIIKTLGEGIRLAGTAEQVKLISKSYDQQNVEKIKENNYLKGKYLYTCNNSNTQSMGRTKGTGQCQSKGNNKIQQNLFSPVLTY